MKSKYSTESRILPGACDASARLGIPDTFEVLMDLATEHADLLGISAVSPKMKGLFWITAKTRIRFYKRPEMMEKVTLETWPETPGRVKCNRSYRILQNGNTVIEGKTEWALYDIREKRLTSASEVYPEDLEWEEDPVLPEGFTRITEDTEEEHRFASYTVASTDIDLGGHMNNVAYVRMIARLFPFAEWNRMNIEEAEAIYRAQCFEKETLTVYRSVSGTEEFFNAVKEDGTTAFQMRIKKGGQAQ
ncbi:MAG: hypothetical protein II510_05420 [Erysipelotrichales bacterium]|nr:hypothetical protein [Erysipelotrichales bacterium]